MSFFPDSLMSAYPATTFRTILSLLDCIEHQDCQTSSWVSFSDRYWFNLESSQSLRFCECEPEEGFHLPKFMKHWHNTPAFVWICPHLSVRPPTPHHQQMIYTHCHSSYLVLQTYRTNHKGLWSNEPGTLVSQAELPVPLRYYLLLLCPSTQSLFSVPWNLLPIIPDWLETRFFPFFISSYPLPHMKRILQLPSTVPPQYSLVFTTFQLLSSTFQLRD